jgi:hypothetical protein
MAAPNLKSPTTITGKTAVYAVTASLGSALTNSAASGKVFKINSIRAANVDGVNDTALDVTFYRSSADTYLVKTVTVPADSALVVISKDEQIYLEEDDAIRAVASAASDIELVISYEDIS